MAQKLFFWKKLDTLLKHRLPLLKALEILKKESASADERIFTEGLLERLRAGAPLSASVEEGALKGILLAGERAGKLPEAVGAVAERLESQKKLRSQLLGASLYPTLVLCLCAGLCALLSAFVLPRFEKLFASMGIEELPALTQGVMALGQALRSWVFWAGLAAAVGAGVAIWKSSRGKGRSKGGLLGRLSAQADFFATMGTLLQNAATLDEALELTAKTARTVGLGEALERGVAQSREGRRLSEILRASGCFEVSQVELTALAETTGSLPESCAHLGRLCSEELQLKIKALMGLLEPSLVIGVALVVAVMVVALFLPMGPLVAKLAG